MPLIRSDTVLINDERYHVAGGVIRKKTIFPEQNYNVQKTEQQFTVHDLHPTLLTYELRDGFNGSGLYVDHGVEYSRRPYFSTLNHSVEDQLVIADRRQSASTLPHTNDFKHYKNALYALTDSGLYSFNSGSSTWGAVAGTPVTPMYNATVHRQYLVIARGSANNVILFDGTTFSNPVVPQTAYLVQDLDDRLFAIDPKDANGLVGVKYTEDIGATAWENAIYIGATATRIPSSSEGQGVCIGPDINGRNVLYVSMSSAVWQIDYEIGRLTLIYDMGHNHFASNGKVLIFWPSTRKFYVNEARTMIEIDLTGESKPVGPAPNAIPLSAIPNGWPVDYEPDYIRCATYNSNYLVIGTQPISGDTALIMKMTPDHKWYFVTKHAVVTEGIRAILFNSNFGKRLYWSEGSGSDDDARFQDFGGDFAEEGELHTPWLTMGLPQVPKCFYELIADLDDLSAAETVTFSYKLDYDEDTSYTFAAISSSSTTHTRTFATSDEIGVEGRAIKIFMKLNRGASVSVSPRILNTRIRWRPKPPPVTAYEFDILVSEGNDAYVNLVDLEDILADAFADRCSVPFKPSGDSDETAITVIPVGHQPDVYYDERRQANVIHLVLIALGDGLNAVAGTVQEGVGPDTALWFSPGSSGAVFSTRGELWRLLSTDETATLMWTAPTDNEFITCLFWSQTSSKLYMATSRVSPAFTKLYSVNTSTGAATEIFTLTATGASATLADPITQAAEFGSKIYLHMGISELTGGDKVQEIRRFDPLTDAHAQVFIYDNANRGGGIAVDPVGNVLVACDGVKASRSADGTTWVADADLFVDLGASLVARLITNRYDDNYVYASLNTSSSTDGPLPDNKIILKRTGAGTWVSALEASIDAFDGITCFTTEYVGTTPVALYTLKKNVVLGTYGPTILRKAAGSSTWTEDWTGPGVTWIPVFGQGLIQFNGQVYAMFHDDNTAPLSDNLARLYKRVAGVWTLVQEWTGLYRDSTGMAVQPNSQRLPHEI